MSTGDQIKVVYVTSSDYKRAEISSLSDVCELKDGAKVGDVFEFRITPLPIKELLEVDIGVMVEAEVREAYSQIKVPCVVEHAGLIFKDHLAFSYPGGLTKPMWVTLGDRFLEETHSVDRPVVARAVVAYCDGMKVRTFVGDTHGTLATSPRGKRSFYWDTIFVPDDAEGEAKGKTYAEIVAHPEYGLAYKMLRLSQSSKAMMQFLEYLRENPRPKLWS